MTIPKTILSLLLIAQLQAAPADDAIALEAKLKETTEASPTGAELMLQLIDLYWEDGQAFGLIRTAGKFTRSQPEHARRAEVMLKLIDGYAATARHDDVITTARQFLGIYPEGKFANAARERLGTAYASTGRQALAAAQLGDAWRGGSETDTGIESLKLWMAANNSEGFKQATALATELVEKLPAGAVLEGVAFQGMEAANRSELWAEGLQLAKNLARKIPNLKPEAARRRNAYEGGFESRLGQHANAVSSYRAALSPGDADTHRALVNAMADAKSPIAEIEAEARRYLAAYPELDNRYEALARTALAAGSDNPSLAINLAQEVIKHDVKSHDMPGNLVGWAGDNHALAEKILLSAISENPEGAPKLRGVLALEVYHGGMKDTAKARAMALQFLAKSPAEDGWSEHIVKFLYDSAADEAAFRKDLAAITASAKAFPHLIGFQDRVWTPSPSDKTRVKEWQKAKKDYESDGTTRLWRQTREDGGKSGQACKLLLQKSWPEETKKYLLSRLAYVYRHHLGGKSKESSSEHYQALCKAFPKDTEAAERWLESSGYADDKMKLTAAAHLLSLPPFRASPDTWVRLVATKDEATNRKAIPWITASSKIENHNLYQSARIGDELKGAGMEKEAIAWWRSRMDLLPNTSDAVTCALRVAGTMETAQARSFLQPRYEAGTDFYGAYAAEIANLAFKEGDFPAMEKILSDARKQADSRPFESWGMSEWPARGWLEAARGEAEWSEEKKAQIYKIVRDLRLGRVSSEAGMILIGEQSNSMSRLLAAQDLIRAAGAHHESWKRLYPFAQSALAREDHSLAAVILNGLLNTTRSVGEAEMAEARVLLRKAYGEMGSLSADIPADSPIAPLLQIILHLRLGENELAEQAYYDNRDLFDAHREEVPVELLLFAAQTHISQGTPEDHERAEDILRGWMVKYGEAENVDIRDKARIQILLAKNYQRASQYDIARAEYTTVLNIFKDQPEAIDAQFGIGETYMAQKVYEQAGEIFTELSESLVPSISIRANFLLGVLSLRQENNDEARKIFLSVLESAPEAELANETLYNLAEVYGVEQRFLTQLETLRTVGRLGQESKIWQTPGNALPIVVQDPDLGISRGDTRIPVIVRTEPGNDSEKSFLSSGGAGKGIFLTEIPTVLGEAKPGDGILQVTGGDTITVDYPEDFKKQFQFEFLSDTKLRIASDGDLQVASSEIIDKDDETFTEKLKDELIETEDKPRSATRPANQVKPGNLVYMQVKDGDRDLTAEPDTVSIKLTASSGDEVQFDLTEKSAHNGIFQGTVRTGELPAGASASDSAIDHNPLMAIDHDEKSAWRSEPDGAAPKSLSVDMKELRQVENIVLTSPDAEREAPVRMVVRGGHDGRFQYKLAEFPTPEEAPSIDFNETGMNLRTYQIPAKNLRETYKWQEIVDIAKKIDPTSNTKVETLAWEAAEEETEAHFLLWTGSFVQERDGAVRVSISGKTTALMLDGRLELAPGEGGRDVDLFLARGVHDLVVFSISTPEAKAVEAQRARENRNSSAVTLRPFVATDFDTAAIPDLEKIERAPLPVITKEENRWILKTPPRELRHVDFEFLEYVGEAIAVSNVEISGGGNRHIPSAENVIELAGNDILELAPGDTVEVSYLDEITAGGEQRNRLLSKTLTATYYNAEITPIGYDFVRNADGELKGDRKELLRIEPGERIVAEVVDFDQDIGLDRDSVVVEVQVNGEPAVTFPATETDSSTGIFIAEIETSAKAEEGKLLVKSGDRVYLRYKDKQNTFPGHAFTRESAVFLNEPTDGMVRILDSETPVDGVPHILSAPGAPPADHVSKVDYALPLTFEVIDPDMAKDSSSKVIVEIVTSQGATAKVECVLSRAFAGASENFDETRNPALFEGRFTGQIPMHLGGLDSSSFVAADELFAGGAIGKVLSDEGEAIDETADKATSGFRVLNVIGSDTFTARYEDSSRPSSDPTKLEATAALYSAASLRITDGEYVEEAEISYVGQKLYLMLTDPDRDLTDERDKALVRVLTVSGEDETIELEETLSHSGVFNGSFPLVASQKPVPGNFVGNIECFFGDEITVGYLDNVAQTPDGLEVIERKIPVAVGTDGEMAAFSKVFKNEDLAIQTQFHIAESHFELFKGHRKLENTEEAEAALQAGRRVLRELGEDYPNPEYAPRVSYLLGQFAQEMAAWDEAIAAYGSIVRNHPEHNLAPDSQYKLGQCYEEAGELDEALEAYVTLAATYPKSPLVANVMLRINEHFYVKEEYAVAASVGAKFVERFPNHEWTPKMAFRIGQCHYKLEEYGKGGEAFDVFVKRFPDQELTAQALFWAGESYRMGNNIPEAFRRYNRCRWDFPESDAAKYSRGRLALPELLAQFEREANLDE